MKKRITTILLTFAIAITGINTPADKANAETKEAKTSAETATEAPSETTVPTSIKTPSATPIPGWGIGATGVDENGQEIINTEEGPKPYTDELYFSYWPLPTQMPTATPAPTRTPVIGEYRNWGNPETMEIYTENGWEKIVWKMWDTCGDLRLTPTGWRNRYDDDVIDEYNKAALAAEAAEAAKKPHDIRIGTFNRRNGEYTMRLEDGDTTEITKGFDTELSFKATGDASPNWTSSNPDAVTIAKTTQNKDKKTAVLTGKNYGTSVVTAEYNGYKISITVKVMKNEFQYKEKTRDWGYNGKKKTMEYTAEGSAVVSYDKKGNLVVKYTEKNFKWKKSKAKAKIAYKGLCVTMSDEKGKTVFNKEAKNFRMTVSPKKKTASGTAKIQRKYLKKKKILDLRKCSFMTMKKAGKVTRRK